MEFFDLKRGKGKMKVSSKGKMNNSSNIEINNKIGRTSTYKHLFYKFPENIMIGMLSDNDIYKLHMKNNSTKIHYRKINKDDKNSVMSGEWNGKEKYSTITFMREYREGSVFPISLLSLLYILCVRCCGLALVRWNRPLLVRCCLLVRICGLVHFS